MLDFVRIVESKQLYAWFWYIIWLCTFCSVTICDYGCLLMGDAVGERRWWITNLTWNYIYELSGLNLWVHIHGVIIPKSVFGYNELMLT